MGTFRFFVRGRLRWCLWLEFTQKLLEAWIQVEKSQWRRVDRSPGPCPAVWSVQPITHVSFPLASSPFGLEAFLALKWNGRKLWALEFADHNSKELKTLVVKNLPANAGDPGSVPGWGKSPGGGNGNPHQYSCLGKSYGQRSLAGYSPWGWKESMQLSSWAHVRMKNFWKM